MGRRRELAIQLSKRRVWPFALIVAIASAALIFVAPLYVPMKPLRSVSASYLAGFNNAFAIRSAVLMSVLVFLWSKRRRRQLPFAASKCEKNFPIGRQFLMWILIGNATVFVFCGFLVIASGTRYLGDAGYIIEQANVLQDTGRSLYTGVEFAYGPLLIWPEVWVNQIFHCGMPLAYFITLIVESSLGILLLTYVLNQIPAERMLKRWTLAHLVFGALTPHLGLNYTFFPFASALAVLMYATHTNNMWRCALLLGVGEAVELLISPELAFVLTAGAVVFAVIRAWNGNREWILVGIVPVTTLLLLLLTVGKPYMQMTSSFAQGALSLPVGPYPHILILLAALIWMCLSRWGCHSA